MKPVLTDNAFEAWAAAIRFCDDIKDGKATLQYQKSFVASLHNAVELFMKQMLLNNNDHKIAEIRTRKNETSVTLQLKYNEAINLNKFFRNLTDDELSQFYTIQFGTLIGKHKELFGNSLSEGETLDQELKLLQKLRNNETHFIIRQGSFLSEEDFCVLHNFMIRFYKILEDWCPNDEDDYEMYLLPYWGGPDGADEIYGFKREPLQNFSYYSAVKNSKLAKKIAKLLVDNPQYGAIDYSPYSIAKDIVEFHDDLSAQFEEIWSIVYMMQSLNLITVDEILIEETGQMYSHLNINFE